LRDFPDGEDDGRVAGCDDWGGRMKYQWIPAAGLGATIALCAYMVLRADAQRRDHTDAPRQQSIIEQPVARPGRP